MVKSEKRIELLLREIEIDQSIDASHIRIESKRRGRLIGRKERLDLPSMRQGYPKLLRQAWLVKIHKHVPGSRITSNRRILQATAGNPVIPSSLPKQLQSQQQRQEDRLFEGKSVQRGSILMINFYCRIVKK